MAAPLLVPSSRSAVARALSPGPQPAELAEALRKRLRGEVRFDAGTRSLYATDLSIYRHPPIGVVIPRTIDDVVATVETCRRYDVPLLGRGCGTSLAGQTCNVAVVIDFSKYLNQLISLDPGDRSARVEPGIIRDDLNAAAERHHLTFAPDPATHAYCTVGGMIGNNSCGAHSVMGGKTVENVIELDVLTYDGVRMTIGPTPDDALERLIAERGRRGEIYRRLRNLRDRVAGLVRDRYPRIPRRVSGYNLDELLPERSFHMARALVGTESTCAIVLGARVRLMHSPPHRALLVIGYPDVFRAADQAAPIRRHEPLALECVQAHVIENMQRKGQPVAGARLLPDGDTWLIVEFGGESRDEAAGRARDAQQLISAELHGQLSTRLIADPGEQRAVWHIREAGVGASRVPNVEEAWPSWEDAAVAPEVLGPYLRDFDALLRRYDYRWTLFGHFGDGCVHSRITFDLKTTTGVKAYRRFVTEAADLVVRYGGSLSGEHGDGQARAELLPKMFGPELIAAFREFKSIWDPAGRMNPGKIVDPYPLDRDLRVGPDYSPRPVETFFRFPEDRGSFAAATERCFGVGKCRSLDGETMCPSFKATREEEHTTRGRAHLLFEMMRGDIIAGGWRDPHVKAALDLCLSCKGCKHDCPVAVDMATYKAEFLAHYYAGRLRPIPAYAMGLLPIWARAAAALPGITNFMLHAPAIGRVLKRAGGIAPARELPRFASHTFRAWFARRRTRPGSGRRVLLWPDTFNNYFFPATARAAVRVLEDAGWSVAIPDRVLCCGRPLYDYGMLSRAKRWLEQILTTVGPDLDAGTPIVCLEPSCAAVFRDELRNLLPDQESARRLSRQVVLLDEFLTQIGYDPPKRRGRAIVHGHCHRKALTGMEASRTLLTGMGLDVELLDSGCCGMAGSFGYEAAHYDVSLKAGEHRLLPRVRSAPGDALIVADGFSCREQIAESTSRTALHVADVVAMALPQSAEAERDEVEASRSVRRVAAAAVGVIAVAALAVWLIRRTWQSAE